MTVKRWAPWVALLILVVGAFVIADRSTGRESVSERAAGIADEVRCPSCEGQSAELSDAPAAGAVRQFILEQVQAGVSKGAIEQELEDRYGSDILLRPPASGIDGLVWVLPVVVVVVALACLGLAFRRWHLAPEAEVSEADRARVAEARRDLDA